MSDVILDMLAELRQTRPPVYDADRWRTWLDAIGQTIAALPTVERRWAATTLVAGDVVAAMPGLCLWEAYGTIERAVYAAKQVEPRR